MLTTATALPTLRALDPVGDVPDRLERVRRDTPTDIAGEQSPAQWGDTVRETTSPRHRAPIFFTALVALIALVVAACGSSSGSSGGGGGGGGSSDKPVYGGKITYALEGNTVAFCPPTGQWAISGIEVAEAVYDTLARPTRDPNVYAPYLAKSIDHNADYTEWTIVIRSGITFQDGTPLDANAVKQNIDAWRKGILLGFVFQDIADTTVTAPDTVVVKTSVPWVAFPAYLWASGRTAIAAPAQLNDPQTCDKNMIGTGPFQVLNGGSFDPSTGNVKVVKNKNYWRKGFPYLDEIDFVPQAESSQRINGLQGGQFDITHSSGYKDLSQAQAISGVVAESEPDGREEISHALLNVSKPPLDDVNIRRALAMGTDVQALININLNGKGRVATQVVDKDVMGYVKDAGYPKHDVNGAKKLISDYKAAHGGAPVTFNLQSTLDQDTQQLAQEVQRQMKIIGVDVKLPAPTDQATIINNAIGGTTDAFLWRNYWGQDPDTLYVWFYGGSVVNFNHLNDPIIDAALDKGRTSPDTATRKAAYETFNKRMSSQAYNLWTWYTQWFIAHTSKVHGIVGPNLPNASGKPGTQQAVDVLDGYHQLLGVWKSK